MNGVAVPEAHQPWRRNWSTLFFQGFPGSDVATLGVTPGKQRMMCFVMVEPVSGTIVHKVAESSVSWGAEVLDRFWWLTKNVGLTKLVDNGEDSEEGFCRCSTARGGLCGRDCEMRKVWSECAYWAHKGWNLSLIHI